MKLLDLYGNPNEMSNLGGGGGAAAGPAGRGGGGRAGGGGGGGGRAGAGGGPSIGTVRPGDDTSSIIDPNWEFGFDQGSESLEVFGGGQGRRAGAGGAGGGGGGGGGGGAAAPAGAAASYMKWIYKRPVARYSFIIDKAFRIVQIEAVLGADDPKVRSIKGIKFGSSFATVLKAYGPPDAFDVGGDTIMMRYLVKHHVAFRLNRLAPGKPHQVTAMVVSGGKA